MPFLQITRLVKTSGIDYKTTNKNPEKTAVKGNFGVTAIHLGLTICSLFNLG